MGLGPIKSAIPPAPMGARSSPWFKWQDAVAIVSVLFAFVLWSDLAVYLRIAFVILCAILLIVSFSSHKNWPTIIRGLASLTVAIAAGFVIWWVIQSETPNVVLVWEDPTSIAANSPLTERQLNAAALSKGKKVEGDYIYEPTFNTTLPVGTQTLHVTFIPKDSRIPSREKTVAIAVLEPPVEISPPQVVFSQVEIKGGSGKIPNHFSEQYTFRITNTTDRDVYAIGAELKIKSDHLSVDDFNLGIPRSSWKPLDDSAPEGTRTGDMIAEGIRNREANTSCFAVAIAHLEPHESREVTIRESDPKAGNNDTAVVIGTVYHSTFEPAPTLTSGGRPLLMPKVPFPESGTLEKIVALPHIP